MTHPLVFLLVVAVFVAALATTGTILAARSRRQSQESWEDILSRLTPIDRCSLEQVALDVVDTSGRPRNDSTSASLTSAEIWQLLGGWEGIKALENNCRVLIDLAFYVQRWYPEALEVAEQLRLNTREIEWQIGRLKIAQTTGKLEDTVPMYAQRAAATYYAMTRRVFALYERSNDSMLAELHRAL